MVPERSWCVVALRPGGRAPISSTALVEEERARATLARLREENPTVAYTLARLIPVQE